MSGPDWTLPLEAVHTDGRVVPVELAASPQPDIDGDYALSKPVSGPHDLFHGDGTSYGGGPWFIRNRVDRQFADIAPYEALTLRDRFALAALPVIIADLAQDRNGTPVLEMPKNAARGAYMYADAMLEARK